MYDVIVVGLGAVGSAALYQLAQRGANALGIDAYHPPHTYGSSHGETRITREAVGEGDAYIPLVRRTNAIWQQLEQTTGERLFYPSGGYVIAPSIGGAAWHGKADFVADTVAVGRRHHIPLDVLQPTVLQAALPQLRLSSHDYACYEPGAGVLIPEACIRVQLSEAERFGAVLKTGERVRQIEPDGGGVRIQTDQRTYHAAYVIVTAGASVRDFAPSHWQQDIRVYRQVMYWFAAADLAAFTADRFPWVIWIGAAQSDFFAVFPYVNGGIAGVKVMTETFAQDVTPDTLQRNVTAQEASTFYDQFVSKRLRDVTGTLVHAAACAYTMTPDEHFRITTHPANDRVFVVSACSGHGFKHAAALGESLAQLALNEPTTVDMAAFWQG